MAYTFNAGINGLLGGTINWATDVIKVRPVLSSDTPDRDLAVMTGLGVTGVDVTLTGKTGPVKDNATDRNVFSAANFTFPLVPAGGACNKFCVFKFVTNDAASIPLSICDMDAVTPSGIDIAVTVPAAGLIYSQQ
jgi:hypothetical protein